MLVPSADGSWPRMLRRSRVPGNACTGTRNCRKRPLDGVRKGTAMQPARSVRGLLLRGLFSSALILTIVPAAIASAVAVYVLYAVQPVRGPEAVDRLTPVAVPGEEMSAEHRR